MTLTSTGPTNDPTDDRMTLVMDTGPVVKRLREIQAEIEAMDEMFDLSKATKEAAAPPMFWDSEVIPDA
jgi:hypothetical protein